MKKRVYRYLRERGKNEPPSPLWVRLLWLLGILSFCALAWYQVQMG